MDSRKVTVPLAMGLMLSGCALGPLSSPSGPDGYGEPGGYATSVYPAPEYYYGQPGYVPVDTYAPGLRGGHDSEREWRERGGHPRDDAGRERGGPPPQGDRRGPQMATQPRGPAPVAPSPAARPQVEQNKKLLDQLGFRPNR